MSVKQYQDSVDNGLSLKLIAQAYTEISSLKLKRIREGVEKNRYFLDELTKVYKVVKYSAAQKGILPKYKKDTISIILTSNYRFYGKINTDLIKFYLYQSQKFKTDTIVIGKTGILYLKAMNFQNFQPLTLKTDLPDFGELTFLIKIVADYKKILVFHPKAKTIMIHTPVMVDISQSPILATQTISSIKHNKEERSSFIFEPEIRKVLIYFETQIKTLLIDQTFLEAELTRTASRLITMDEAQSNANEYIKEQKARLAEAKRSTSSKRILENIISVISKEQNI